MRLLQFFNRLRAAGLSVWVWVLFCSAGSPPVGSPPTETIQWRTPNEAVLLARTANKKILFSVHTSWCGWCHVMDKKTWSNPEVVRLINQHFIAVKLDAETKTPLEFLDNTFRFLPDRKVNELAWLILDGKMQYPSTVFLNKNAEILSPVQGFIEADIMIQILQFYGQDHYLTTKWEDFSGKGKK
jgi:thioredoxin-related protein